MTPAQLKLLRGLARGATLDALHHESGYRFNGRVVQQATGLALLRAGFIERGRGLPVHFTITRKGRERLRERGNR